MGTERARASRGVDARRSPSPEAPAPSRRPGPAGGLRALQAAAGNRAVAAALAVQTKLSVGAADDPLEMEADRVARAVSDAIGAGRAGSAALDEDALAARSVPPGVRRRATVGLAGGELDDEAASALAGEIGRGRGLEPTTRRTMEAAFGADFGAVRVHTGEQSAELNDRMQASAFTVGSDIFFRGGEPDMGSRSGRELLGHELTHVVQQTGTGVRRPDDAEA